MIDILADVLNDHHGSQILTGRGLDALREAFLSPREVTTLKVRLNEHRGCVHCGAHLSNESICVMHHGEMHCVRCCPPQTIECHTCQTNLQLPPSVMKTLKKVLAECPVCKERAGQPQPLASVVVDGIDPSYGVNLRLRGQAEQLGGGLASAAAEAEAFASTGAPPVSVAQEAFFTGRVPTPTYHPSPVFYSPLIYNDTSEILEEDDETPRTER